MRRKKTIKILSHIAFHTAVIGLLLYIDLPLWAAVLPLAAVILASATLFFVVLFKVLKNDGKGTTR